MDEGSDAWLVTSALAANPQAREALVRRFLRPAFVVALAIVGNAADAEDIAQESMMVALHRLRQCREPERFAAWLRNSVRNRALKHLRRARVREAFSRRPQPMETSETGSRFAVRGPLIKALTALSEVQREVVMLHDLESWTHGEIAETLGISEVASRQHLFVARKHLRETLKIEPKAKEEKHG